MDTIDSKILEKFENFDWKKALPYGIAGVFTAWLTWGAGLFPYIVLLLGPVLLAKWKFPDLETKKALAFGAILCLVWFVTNLVCFWTFAPVGEIGIGRAGAELFADLIRHPYLITEALSYTDYRLRLGVIVMLFGLLIFAFIQTPAGRGIGLHRIFSTPEDYRLSERNTVGSARWAEEDEMRKYFNSEGSGVVIGKSEEGEPYILPLSNESFEYQRNLNVVVFGTTGSGKTASFIKPNILQADGSFVITDPKKEIYNDTSAFLRNRGYEVYCFNLLDMANSHRWNPLLEKDGTCNVSVQDAVLMASSIIKNTKDPGEGKGDPFWEKSEQALLTALIIYTTRHIKNPEEQNFGNILYFGTGRTATALDFDFGKLPTSDPAKAAYAIYAQAPEKVRSSIIINLGTRMQLFQDEKLAKLTSETNFDLSELGEKKTAIFVVLSDYDNTYNSISALFFTQAFQTLYRQAATNGGTLNTFTRFMMDEFCNIGFIPGYTTKLSTMRSRGISAQMIIQSLGQIENRYPYGQHAEIIGNSDVRLMMGANDIDSAKYFTDLIGKATVTQETVARSDRVVVDAGTRSEREVPRDLIAPDEILRMDNKDILVLVRGGYPGKIHKMHYSEHPSANELEKISALENESLKQKEGGDLQEENLLERRGAKENDILEEIKASMMYTSEDEDEYESEDTDQEVTEEQKVSNQNKETDKEFGFGSEFNDGFEA